VEGRGSNPRSGQVKALRCAGTSKSGLESGPITAYLTTTVVHSSKLLINNVLVNYEKLFFFGKHRSILVIFP